MQAHLKYLLYLLRHKWFVFLYGLQVGVSLKALLLHDMSKFSKEEWGSYVKFQFWIEEKKKSVPNYKYHLGDCEFFDDAWNHHWMRNPHHPEFWSFPYDYPEEMPEEDIREMIADWLGAGRAQNRPFDPSWFEENQWNIDLHPNTRDRIWSILTSLKDRHII